jgi:hypothetical protein
VTVESPITNIVLFDPLNCEWLEPDVHLTLLIHPAKAEPPVTPPIVYVAWEPGIEVETDVVVMSGRPLTQSAHVPGEPKLSRMLRPWPAYQTPPALALDVDPPLLFT